MSGLGKQLRGTGIARIQKAKGGSSNWIQGAIKKPGSLRATLGVKKGETIPTEKLKAAAKKGGKLGQRARFAMNVKGLKESNELENWVNDLTEEKYYPMASKEEILNLINRKLNETRGENALPDFMTYDSIKHGEVEAQEEMSESGSKPAVAPPTTKPGEKKRPTIVPDKGPNKKPKALFK